MRTPGFAFSKALAISLINGAMVLEPTMVIFEAVTSAFLLQPARPPKAASTATANMPRIERRAEIDFKTTLFPLLKHARTLVAALMPILRTNADDPHGMDVLRGLCFLHSWGVS